jgi:hypothetical protein
MQAQDWRELLQLVPRKYHDIIVLLTEGGAEVAVQEVVRMDGPYLVVRGRVSGTTDTDRAFFVPYDSLSFVRFQRTVPDTVLYGFYGLTPPDPLPDQVAAAAPATAEQAAAETPPPAEAAAPADAPAPELSPLAAGATPPRGIDRTKLLERLRQRHNKDKEDKAAPVEGQGSRPLPVS